MVGERRIGILKDLGTEVLNVQTADEACTVAAQVLSSHSKDIPFALLYLIDPQRQCAQLVGTSGTGGNEPTSPSCIECADHVVSSAWPFATVIKDEAIHIVQDLASRFSRIPSSPWRQRSMLFPVPWARINCVR